MHELTANVNSKQQKATVQQDNSVGPVFDLSTTSLLRTYGQTVLFPRFSYFTFLRTNE